MTDRTVTAEPGAISRGQAHAGTMAQWLGRARASTREHAIEIAVVVGLTVLAAALRLYNLENLPAGLHGDEAWTGFDAQRIVEEGWIGVYVGSALGQPTGPLYLTALLFTFLPDDVWTIRLSMAIFGIAALPATYAAARIMFGQVAATIAALLLAVMVWHLHLSRVGFMVVSWTFVEMLALWLLYLGMHRRSVLLCAAAGAVAGLGVYTYNAYLLFVPIPFVAIAWEFFRLPRDERREFAARSVAFAMTMFIAALPLLLYINDNTEFYREHQRVVGVTYSAAWRDEDIAGKADILWARARELNRGLLQGERPDFGDGLGDDGYPVLQPVLYVLAVVGLGISAWRIRRSEYAVLVAAILLLPLGALLTVNDGMYRRTLGLAPFVAILAALPLAELWKAGARKGGGWRYASAAGVIIIAGYAGVRGTADYFGPMQDTRAMRFTFASELEDAARYIDTLPDDTIVYFYSDRWPYGYETRRYLAPMQAGVDRSIEFRGDRGVSEPVDYGARRNNNIAFVFLGRYIGGEQEIARRFPAGTMTEARRDGRASFSAYYVP